MGLQETNHGLSKLGFPCDNDDKNKSPDIKRSASSFPVNDPTETRVEANASVNDCTKQDVKKSRSKSKKKKAKKVKKKKKNKDYDPLSNDVPKHKKAKKKDKKVKKEVVMKGAMTKEEWEKLEKNKNVVSLPDNDSKRLHYDENKRKEKAECAWVLSGSPPPPHIRAAYKTFKKPQGF